MANTELRTGAFQPRESSESAEPSGGRQSSAPSGRKRRLLKAIAPQASTYTPITGKSGPGIARFDITLAAPDGVVAVQIEGFTIHKLEGDISFGSVSASAAAKTPSRPLSPAEQRLFHNIEQGILPENGADAFLAALASGEPQMLVSSLDLPGLIKQVERDAEPKAGAGQTFERPDLDSEYVEPEGEIERRLAGFWSDLLGIEEEEVVIRQERERCTVRTRRGSEMVEVEIAWPTATN